MVSSSSVYTCARAVTVMVTLLTPIVAQASTLTVPAGGDLQAALNTAKPGDTILLEPGATYVGHFELPVHGGTAYITLRTSDPAGYLPSTGVRITPTHAPYLAKLRSPDGMPALSTKAGAAYWRVMLVEFAPNRNGAGDIIALGKGTTAQNALSLVPRHLILDRVYIHGDPELGQKRGIALNCEDATIINSHISDMKAIGLDTQAIAGWNGPGPFHIENNYLEAAGYGFILGGDDPKIDKLVPSNVVFRGNVVTRPVSWRNPIVPTPSGVVASAGSGGTLAAGTYGYRVLARRPVASNTASSAQSAQVTATVVAGGKVTITWKPVSGATGYRVYGRTVGSQAMYWTVTGTSFTDIGAAGTVGSAPAATVWQVKNLFELKNARNVQIDYNVIENHWQQAQAGPAVLFTVRNQYGGCTWCVVENITFEYNVVRNIAAGIHILGIDPNHPSQQTNNITIRNNEISGLDKSLWGGNGYFMKMVDNPRDITIDHNTIISPSGGGLMTVSGPPIYGVKLRNNVAPHNSYGIIGQGYGSGNPSIAAYLPDLQMERNVLAGGKASSYPTDNFFPTLSEFQPHFKGYVGGDYSLVPGTDWESAATDGKDLGADYQMLRRRPSPKRGDPPTIVTTALSPTTEFDYYSATLEATGGTTPYRWSVTGGTLPAGIALDPLNGTLTGAVAASGDFTFIVQLTDASGATATQPLSIHAERAIPRVEIVTQWVEPGQAQVAYSQHLEATGGLGTYAWNLVGGTLPAGVTLKSSGDLQGTPQAAGNFAFTVSVEDAADPLRYATRSFVLSVAPPPNRAPSVTVSVPSGRVSVGAPVTLSAIAMDQDGYVKRVDFFVNGGLVGSAYAALFQVQWITRDGGPHVVTAIATDDDNATMTSKEASIDVISEIVIYATDVRKMSGNFQLVADATAADGQRLWNANKGTAKLAVAAVPANYAEFMFYAEAGRAYHIWMRGKADSNNWANDSTYLQFSGTVDAAGAPVYRIGTTGYSWYSLEEDSSMGVSGWGWQDNGFGLGVMGPSLYFEQTGLQTLRIQQREDGLSIDQIVISPTANLMTSPGVTKNDSTIVTR